MQISGITYVRGDAVSEQASERVSEWVNVINYSIAHCAYVRRAGDQCPGVGGRGYVSAKQTAPASHTIPGMVESVGYHLCR